MDKLEFAFDNEAMLLGAILQDETILDEISLQPKHFLFDVNRNMFKAMLKLNSQGDSVSFVTLTSQPEQYIKKMGGMDHIAAVMNTTPSVSAFRKYEKTIKEFYIVETARTQAKEFIEQTSQVNDTEALNAFLQKAAQLETGNVTSQGSFKEKLKNRVIQHYNSPTEGLSGVDTGFRTTNKYTDGWQKGELIVIAGRPSMGKTAFILNSLLRSCRNDDNVFATFFSIEMPDETVIDRLIASTARININKMRNPNKTFSNGEWDVYSKSVGVLETLNFDIRNERTVSEIRAATRKNMKQYPDKKHVIAIDYLTLMKPSKSSGSRTYDVEEIIIGLNDIATQLNIPVIVLSQLSRGVESRENKRPNMGDLRDSGAIEQAADVIIMLYRDEYYNEQSNEPGVVELIFSKNRQGSTGTVKMHFDKKTNNFGDMS